MHIPVLLNEILEAFSTVEINKFVDGTVGAGGHSHAILEAHPEIQRLYGIDQDQSALDLAKKKLGARAQLIHGSFRKMGQLVEGPVEGILLDIGVSSMQLDQEGRGFSFMKEGPLDMRMDKSQRLTAKEVVNRFSERKLGEIFRDLGGEPKWKGAAKAIVEARGEKHISTTQDLVHVLAPVLTWSGRRRKKIHPMTLVFQALRIYVNDEIGALEEGLAQALELLSSGGRLAVITFHSLEDRVVKQRFMDARRDKRFELVNRKPMGPSEEESKENPRSRSAKLRVIEKL